MSVVIAALGFPVWLRVTHLINLFFLGLLARSGIQILGAYPRLYWSDNSTPGREWLTLTRRAIPTDRPWTTLEQEQEVSPWLGQPGGNNLGLGRHWHFASILFWVLNGVVYVILLFATGEWSRLIPTSWSIVPDAWNTFLTYATLRLPPASAFRPYDPLQQLTYAAVVFLLGPFLILTGAAQSPAVEARFPWYARLFGGRQSARSLHFLGLLAFVAFTLVHTALVLITGPGRNLGDIVLGQHQTMQGLAIGIAAGVVILIFAIYWLTSRYSRARPRAVQRAFGALIHTPMRWLARSVRSRQEYSREDLAPFFPVNGEPPDSPAYLDLLWSEFDSWRLEVSGLVAHPANFTLKSLRALPQQTQITKHHCIQGWSAIGEWTGAPMAAILALCEPLPNARYVCFVSYSRDHGGEPFYETLPIEVIRQPQTLLAYEMNGAPLSLAHGAPLRLRAETELGFKMVKWLRCIEFVEDYRLVRGGMGGSRERNMYYEEAASI